MLGDAIKHSPNSSWERISGLFLRAFWMERYAAAEGHFRWFAVSLSEVTFANILIAGGGQ